GVVQDTRTRSSTTRKRRTAYLRETTTSKCKAIARARGMPRTTNARGKIQPLSTTRTEVPFPERGQRTPIDLAVRVKQNRVDHHDGGGHLEGSELFPAVLESRRLGRSPDDDEAESDHRRTTLLESRSFLAGSVPRISPIDARLSRRPQGTSSNSYGHS